MKILDKMLLILLVGSIWGAAELYGWDLLRALNVENKSGFIFGVAFFILLASKQLLRFPFALTIAAIITVFFKTFSVAFFACQAGAVMIIATVIDLGYHLITERRLDNWKTRTLFAPVIAFISQSAFAVSAVYIIRQPNWVERGIPGIINFLLISGSIAMLSAVIVVNPAYLLGKKIKDAIERSEMFVLPGWTYAIGLFLIAIIWFAGYLY